MAGRPKMTASKGSAIAEAAHELYNLVKKHCPGWYTETGHEFADDDFIARYWRHNLRAAKDMLNYSEQLEGWLYERAELPVPTRRDESSFEPFWWEPGPTLTAQCSQCDRTCFLNEEENKIAVAESDARIAAKMAELKETISNNEAAGCD